MGISKQELARQLEEYRKASRAMMWCYDSSQILMDLIMQNVDPGGCLYDWQEEYPSLDSHDKPYGITDDAFMEVTKNHDWMIKACSHKDWMVRPNGVALYVYCYLDYFAKRPTEESLSVLVVYAYRATKAPTRGTTSWDDLEDIFTEDAFQETPDLLGDSGLAKLPMPLKSFEGVHIPTDTIQCDYAVGLYDLASLIDEEAVMKTVVADTNHLLKRWCE